MNTEPDFINAEGFKWWLHGDLSKYAKRNGLDMLTWIVESPKGVCEFVTLSKGQPVHATQSLEAVGIWLDIQKAARDMK
jgi:hypothetical protein